MEKWLKRLNWAPDKRTVILLSLLGLLLISSYANYYLGSRNSAVQTSLPVARVAGAQPTANPTATPGQTPAESGTFAAFRQDRGVTRAQEIQMLDQLIADKNTSAEVLEQARVQKLALVKRMECEASLEGMLKAKGFEDVIVSALPQAVTVVVKAESLTSAQATQILEMAVSQTQEEARNIKIIPTN